MSKFKFQFSNNGRTLNMSGNNMTDIPQNSKIVPRKIIQLDLSNNNLKKLSQLKNFINLSKLDLSNNGMRKLKREDFVKLKRLETLSVDHNAIDNVDNFLDSVGALTSLTNLSMIGNPFVPQISIDPKVKNLDYHRFRLYIIHHLPQLKVLDKRKIGQAERQNSERTGAYCRINRIDVPEGNVTEFNIEEEGEEDRKRIRSYFGYTKKEYIGLNSQGNRFIKDL